MQQLSTGRVGALVCPHVAILASRPKPSFRPVLCRGLPGFGSSGLPKATSNEWQVPSNLLPSRSPGSAEGSPSSSTDGSANSSSRSSSSSSSKSTVYTVRLTTSWDRGAALSEPMAGVNVCLISKDGSAVLHRIAPVNDPRDNLQVMQQICSLVGEESGADCSSVSSMDAPVWPAGKEPVAKLRFQEGAVDEVSFVAQELGDLAAIMLAPEGGSWMCDEVDVSSSRTSHTDRFVCRKRLGGRKGEPAAYLTPVPPDAVVYGSGEGARVITKEQAAVLQAMSLADYSALKSRLLITTSLLTLGGSGVAAVASGVEAAVPFAIGGMAGLLYQLLLQLGADAAVATASSQSDAAAAQQGRAAAAAAGDAQQGFQARMLQLLGSSAVRLALLTSAALLALWAVQESGTRDGAGEGMLLQLTPVDAWQLGLGLCGFMMYKIAVLGVSLVPVQQGKVPQPAQQVEKNA
uniref:DUF7755 domain-containing protein n=1 Tax=Tetradesmus obliquus TaxID=3088 RepID=A0A383VRU7_TETOB|eukprot:jgi/Sobl393_1/18294/SZX77891.1